MPLAQGSRERYALITDIQVRARTAVHRRSSSPPCLGAAPVAVASLRCARDWAKMRRKWIISDERKEGWGFSGEDEGNEAHSLGAGRKQVGQWTRGVGFVMVPVVYFLASFWCGM